jgi:site-specific recombinase XerD
MQPAPESIATILTEQSESSGVPIRSFAQKNLYLVEDFERYLIALGRSESTRRAYLDAVGRLVEVLGSKDAAELDRSDIRKLQSQLLAKGCTANSIRLHVAGIRAFCKFLRLAGLTIHDPTLVLAHRKQPSRLPRVLTAEEIGRLIAAASTALERAVVEVLYATGVRVSELVALRVDDITWSEPGVIRVHRGKGDKDRIVLFGKKAAAAIRKYLGGRETGFLFEAPARTGEFFGDHASWYARLCVDGVQRCVRLGKFRGLSEADARAKFERLKAETVGFHAHPAGPYNTRSIRLLLSRLSSRAKVAGLHPHALRRACATHMLQGGADLRAIQELLGHENVTTTMIYTNLQVSDLVAIHARYHPHAKED